MSLAMQAAKALGALGEPPPRRLTRKLLRPLGPLAPRGRALDLAALAAHFGFGAAMGALYGFLPVGLRTPAGGALFGLGVWGVNYAGWLPKAGLMPEPSRDRLGRPTSMIAAHLVFGTALAAVERRISPVSMRGKVVVIGGGSRGLGRAVAEQLVRQGASVAICGRSLESLESTRRWLEQSGGRVLADVCDLRDEQQTTAFLARVERELGPIDVVVANAATLEVGPCETFAPADFDAAMREIFGSAMHLSVLALPRMRARHSGTLVFITSIGGRLGVPHLAAYSAAKFAQVGLAEALHAEVAKDGVRVLTVMPGLMRTGSHLRATFRGRAEAELTWFGASAIAPLVSIDADRAARHVVRAMARQDRFLMFTPAAQLGTWLHDFAPNAWSSLAGLIGRLLPGAPAAAPRAASVEGLELVRRSDSWLLNAIAARSEPLMARHGQ
jgi:NAD(P)-dependent dehydrogenase (short-subunit alcohol dehydrogenase family)